MILTSVVAIPITFFVAQLTKFSMFQNISYQFSKIWQKSTCPWQCVKQAGHCNSSVIISNIYWALFMTWCVRVLIFQEAGNFAWVRMILNMCRRCGLRYGQLHFIISFDTPSIPGDLPDFSVCITDTISLSLILKSSSLKMEQGFDC